MRYGLDFFVAVVDSVSIVFADKNDPLSFYLFFIFGNVQRK